MHDPVLIDLHSLHHDTLCSTKAAYAIIICIYRHGRGVRRQSAALVTRQGTDTSPSVDDVNNCSGTQCVAGLCQRLSVLHACAFQSKKNIASINAVVQILQKRDLLIENI